MQIKKVFPYRIFQVGQKKNNIFLKDTLHIKAKKNDKIIFPITKSESIKFHIKKWGFILDNEINKKQKNLEFVFFGAHKKKIHLICFLKKCRDKFNKYCRDENLTKINIKKFINEISKK